MHVYRSRFDLVNSRGAAVAVLFATAILPVTMLTALVFDFGSAAQAKAQLDLAADSAAIAAARTSADAYARGVAQYPDYIARGQAAGAEWFNAQTGSVVQAHDIVPRVTVVQNGSSFAATVSYNADVTNLLPNLMNATTSPGTHISNTAASTITVNQFATVDFLLDNTGSMMIAATPADATKMIAAAAAFPRGSVPSGLGGVPCTFACHWSGSGPDYLSTARAAGITLRYDVVQSATQIAIQQMSALELVVSQLNVGVFTFGDPQQPFTTLVAEQTIDGNCAGNDGNSCNGKFNNGRGNNDSGGPVTKGGNVGPILAAVKANAPPVFQDNTSSTYTSNFAAAFQNLADAVGPSGTGATLADPKKAVILVSDGIGDDNVNQSIPSTEGPINPAACAVMKAKGFQVYVLYTTYSSDPVNLPYGNIALTPYIQGTAANDLVPSLIACASAPQNFVQANSPADIQGALTQLLQMAVGSTTRLTN